MKLWRQNALSLQTRPSITGTDYVVEAAVAKAMSNNELSMDSESLQFIYRYVQASPSTLKPLLRVISSRVNKSQCWTVALKGLMLMHGFFLNELPAAESIGRLPFDLSSFGDTYSWMHRSFGFDRFLRAYFVYLDQRSILFHDTNLHRHREESSVMIQLAVIRKMQNLIDLLMRIKPITENMKKPLIIEAMDNVITGIADINRGICRRLAESLPNIDPETGISEAEMALRIAVKSISQGEDLCRYFEFCREFGVPSARDIPDFVRIPETDMIKLERLIRRKLAAGGTEKGEEAETETREEGRGEKQNLEEYSNPKSDDIPDLISL